MMLRLNDYLILGIRLCLAYTVDGLGFKSLTHIPACTMYLQYVPCSQAQRI